MKGSLKAVVILQVGIALALMSALACADSPAVPHDYTKLTKNKEYVFVMLAPGEYAPYQNPAIRSMYKQSGLYRNDGSTTPLWVVYWYSFEVYPSSDGKHLVRMGPWASSTVQMALSFYRNGQEIKEYRISDLIRDESKLQHSVSHFSWRSELQFYDEKGLLFLKTKDDQTYRFSVETGQIQ